MCADAGTIIAITGAGRRPGQIRIELMKTNVEIAKDITHNIMKAAGNPLILVVENPAGDLTDIVKKGIGAGSKTGF